MGRGPFHSCVHETYSSIADPVAGGAPAGARGESEPDSLLPDAFAGWQKSSPAHSSANPADADKVNPDLLKEFGFNDFQDATYRKGDRKIEIKAIRFADASGAYGAFTFYTRRRCSRKSW